MKARFAIPLLLAVCLFSGCTFKGHMYPVSGPLASQNPAPVYSAQITGTLNPTGFAAVLANGEKFKGGWNTISTEKRRMSDAAGAPAVGQLKAAWDAVYGQGFYTAHVLGTKYFAGTTLTGSAGTVLTVEIYRPVQDANPNAPGPIDIRGVAQDSHGNIYKLVL